MRSNLKFSDEEIAHLIQEYKRSDDSGGMTFNQWPMGFSLQQVERIIKDRGLSESLRTFLEKMLLWPHLKQNANYYGSDLEKARVKTEKLLFQNSEEGSSVPAYVLPEDQWAPMVNGDIAAMDEETAQQWFCLLHEFIKVSGSKPSAKYLKTTSELIDSIGAKPFKQQVYRWIEEVISMNVIETVHSYNNSQYHYSTYAFLHEKNQVLLKGLVWSLTKFHDSQTLNWVAKLTVRAFQKIPGTGPTAASVGNACIYVLGHTKGLEGISHLSRLKLQIRQTNTKKLIEKYLEESSAKLGVSSHEIEERSIPDFGLAEGRKSYAFEDYKLEIEIRGIGQVTSTWIKPDGQFQKTAPAFTKSKAKHKEQLKKAKNEVAQIKKYLTSQRDRIDRSYLYDRVWKQEDFSKYYLHHGLISFLAKDLVWEFNDGNKFVSALYQEGQWIDYNGQDLDWIEDSKEVRLWHPVNVTSEEVMLWRAFFEESQRKQALKQVYREVYLLTDAEIQTGVYSNRMAAHILKQHQFNALTALRGWRYSLLGAYDDGKSGEIARIPLKEHQLEAQFWVDELAADDAFNDTGIWDYVTTDQVRFLNNLGDGVPLSDIPKIVFSEIMRDTDLFVGVASVGNDPQWIDGGGLRQEYRPYWHSYSFGELNEIAKTRKTVLEKLVPKLRIAKVSQIEGKFLKVKGKKRTYKIHIGSSNILMEPNDQYLCIVPARGKDSNLDNVFLPFEGDRGLSLVLSKAFLLADDDKITDSTIISQIG